MKRRLSNENINDFETNDNVTWEVIVRKCIYLLFLENKYNCNNLSSTLFYLIEYLILVRIINILLWHWQYAMCWYSVEVIYPEKKWYELRTNTIQRCSHCSSEISLVWRDGSIIHKDGLLTLLETNNTQVCDCKPATHITMHVVLGNVSKISRRFRLRKSRRNVI